MLRTALVASMLMLLASCGGKTEVTPSGGAAGSSTGGGGSGGGATGGFGGTSFGGTSFGGSGGSGVGGVGACGPQDPGTECGALGEVGCLAAFPRCVPVYDDHCCPSCDPTGGCADCIDFRFHHCSRFEESGCGPGPSAPCGQTPSWACQGQVASCPKQGPCNFVAGCTEAVPASCPSYQSCEPECHATSAWTCGPTCDPSPAPTCEKGAAEAGPNGYTGFCVRAAICGLEAGVCPATAPAPASACTSEGLVCQYTGFCAPTCTCKQGVWACLTPPC